jgi:hypothetical protein
MLNRRTFLSYFFDGIQKYECVHGLKNMEMARRIAFQALGSFRLSTGRVPRCPFNMSMYVFRLIFLFSVNVFMLLLYFTFVHLFIIFHWFHVKRLATGLLKCGDLAESKFYGRMLYSFAAERFERAVSFADSALRDQGVFW